MIFRLRLRSSLSAYWLLVENPVLYGCRTEILEFLEVLFPPHGPAQYSTPYSSQSKESITGCYKAFGKETELYYKELLD